MICVIDETSLDKTFFILLLIICPLLVEIFRALMYSNISNSITGRSTEESSIVKLCLLSPLLLLCASILLVIFSFTFVKNVISEFPISKRSDICSSELLIIVLTLYAIRYVFVFQIFFNDIYYCTINSYNKLFKFYVNNVGYLWVHSKF